jgi:hypothetical protein
MVHQRVSVSQYDDPNLTPHALMMMNLGAFVLVAAWPIGMTATGSRWPGATRPPTMSAPQRTRRGLVETGISPAPVEGGWMLIA